MKKKLILLFLLLSLLLSSGCMKKNIEYHSNPYSLDGSQLGETPISIGAYSVSLKDNYVTFIGEKNFEIELPEEISHFISIQLSYDQSYAAYNVKLEEEVKFFILDFKTGEVKNISDIVGDNYNYDGFTTDLGMAWSPKENTIIFVGGYENSASVVIYYLDFPQNQQNNTATRIYEDIKGVKWNAEGDKFYFLGTSTQLKEDVYSLYKGNIFVENGYAYADKIYEIKNMNAIEVKEWLDSDM